MLRRRSRNGSKDRPNWELLGLVIGVVGVLATLAAWLWPTFFSGSDLPEIYGIRVQVLDPDGNPVGGAKVRASTGNEALYRPVDEWWEIQVPRGKVPKDGKISLWAEHPDWETNRTDLVVGSDPNVRAEIRLKTPQAWIRGRVVDEANNTLAGVHIGSQDGLPGTATSGGDGTFALQLAVARETRVGLRADLNGWTPETTYCFAGRSGCEIVLTKP